MRGGRPGQVAVIPFSAGTVTMSRGNRTRPDPEGERSTIPTILRPKTKPGRNSSRSAANADRQFFSLPAPRSRDEDIGLLDDYPAVHSRMLQMESQ